MSNFFLGLLGLALTGLIYIGYKYFHTKMLEREAAAKEKIEALMDAYRRQKKGKGSKDPDLEKLTEQVEVLPASPGASLYWRRFWYIGLAVAAVLAALWITVGSQKRVEETNLKGELTESAATEMEDAGHHDENEKGLLNSIGQARGLELLQMSHSHYGKQVVINGLVRNISIDTLNNISVVILFEDDNEDFLTSAQGRLLYGMVMPGEKSPFKVETIEEHGMTGFRVTFRTHEGAPLRYEDVRKSFHDYINPPAKEKKQEEDEEKGHHETG